MLPCPFRHRLTLLLASAVLVGGISCGEEAPSRRALLIGLDGATLRVIEPLFAEGKLPNLLRIAEEGVSGPLRSFEPLLSPRIWNTVATGKTPDEHGITSWVWVDDAGNPRLFLSSQRKVPALWNIASEAGLRVGVVNWLNTYPPEVVGGVMISDHATPILKRGKQFLLGAFGEAETGRAPKEDPAAMTAPVAYPQAWQERLPAILGSEEPAFPLATPESLPSWIRFETLAEGYASDLQIARLALEVEEEERPDLLMVLFPGVDRISHLLWGNIEPAEEYPPHVRPTPKQRQAGADALRGYYELADRLVGDLVARFDDEDLVMVISDHGFEAGIPGFGLTGGHDSPDAMDGIVFARGAGVPRGASAGSMRVHDVTPTLLAWLGLPVAEDMKGRPAAWVDPGRITRVASYDGQPIERLGDGESGVEEEMIEGLRALGYVEEP